MVWSCYKNALMVSLQQEQLASLQVSRYKKYPKLLVLSPYDFRGVSF